MMEKNANIPPTPSTQDVAGLITYKPIDLCTSLVACRAPSRSLFVVTPFISDINMAKNDHSASCSDSEPPDDDSVSLDGRSFLSHDSDESELCLLAHTLDNNHPYVTSHQPVDRLSPIMQVIPPEIVEFLGNTHENDPTTNTSTTENTTSHNNKDDDTRARPQNKSIMQWSFIENNTLFVSLDIETSGTHCGIVQLSAELFHLVHLPGAKKSTSNHYVIVGHL